MPHFTAPQAVKNWTVIMQKVEVLLTADFDAEYLQQRKWLFILLQEPPNPNILNTGRFRLLVKDFRGHWFIDKIYGSCMEQCHFKH